MIEYHFEERQASQDAKAPHESYTKQYTDPATWHLKIKYKNHVDVAESVYAHV